MALSIRHCNKDQFGPKIKVLPSTKIYFNDYPYRVDIVGPGHPHPDYDPHMHYEISDFMKSCNMLWKRELHSEKGRCIYLGTYDDVLWLCNWMEPYIKAVHGPLNDEHVSCLYTPGLLLREKLFYSRYDYRIEFASAPWRHTSNDTTTKENLLALQDFVTQNFDDYRWSTNDFSWYYSYLYCKEKEFKEIEGFMMLSFKHMFRYKDKVKLFSEL